MEPLNLPSFPVKIRQINQKVQIFDPFRKKFVMLTPEEWVRQHFADYLITSKGYPAGLISTELPLNIADKAGRSDLVVHDRKGSIVMVIECKAPHITLSQEVFDQVSAYNYRLQAKYMVVTNGLTHYCFQFDRETKIIRFVSEIPFYGDLINRDE
jgi:predicted type IV restriction endonuclease